MRDYLGKYFSELFYSTDQEKYKNTKLDTIFDQRFYIQNNKVQMIIDASVSGLSLVITGNEIYISKELYDHPSVIVYNSIEHDQSLNPRSLFNPETFSTLAYLMCQNRLIIELIDEPDEPIYVRYRSDFETFHSAAVLFKLDDHIDAEIVEEIESQGALNVTVDYILHPRSRLNLSTFYKNNISATSIYYRNIVLEDGAHYNHMMLGKGSYSIIDENRIQPGPDTSTALFGIINSPGKDFHTILFVDPSSTEYKISAIYKEILSSSSDVSFSSTIMPPYTNDADVVEVLRLNLDEHPEEHQQQEIETFINDIADMVLLERMSGVKRFYNNKEKFLKIL